MLNEMCEFKEFNDKPQTLTELLDRNSPELDIAETSPFNISDPKLKSNKEKFKGNAFGATMKNLLH